MPARRSHRHPARLRQRQLLRRPLLLLHHLLLLLRRPLLLLRRPLLLLRRPLLLLRRPRLVRSHRRPRPAPCRLLVRDRVRSRIAGTVVSTTLRRVLPVVVAVAAAASCVPPPQAPPDLADRSACTAAAIRSCALPYPSDEFTVPDPSSATGRRVAVPEGVVPDHLQRQLGPGLDVAGVFAGADGFSALGPVVFELDRPVRVLDIPVDGGDVVAVYDRDSGERIPVRVRHGADGILRGGASPVVSAWPALRWTPGRTYVARITTDVPAVTGRVLRSAGMEAPDAYLSSVRSDLLRIEGDRWAGYAAATRFTVRSSANANVTLDSMVAQVRSREHPVRSVQVGAPLLVPSAGAVVTGQVRLDDFRGPRGRVDATRPPRPQWEQFLLVLPRRPAGPAGAPVVVYGHGLTINKETLLEVADDNAARGVATIGIDVPNHGSRSDEGGYLLDITDPAGFGRLSSIAAQSTADHVGLISALRTSFATLDVGPWRVLGPAGDGRVDLDPSRILYVGTSMGGVLGASLLAHEPGLLGGYLQVAGTGIAEILFTSLLWPAFSGVVPGPAEPGDAAALQGAATMLLDAGDHGNLVDRLRQGPPVFLQYGLGDEVVGNEFSERLAARLDLPRVGPQVWPTSVPLRAAPGTGVPADGRGFRQTYPLDSSPEFRGFGAHLSFASNAGDRSYAEWLDNRLRAAGVGRP